MQTNLLVWKSILFFAYKEICDIFTGLTYFLLAMAKGPISFHKLKSSKPSSITLALYFPLTPDYQRAVSRCKLALFPSPQTC